MVTADGEDGVPPVHHGRVADERDAGIDRGNHVVMRHRMGRAVVLPREAVLADVLAPAADDSVVGIRGKEGELAFESLRHADIVGVHARDQCTARFGEELVETGDETAILPRDDADSRIAGGMVAGDPDGGIGRAIVENQEFEVAKGLLQDRFHRLCQEAFAIIYAHRHADRGGAGGTGACHAGIRRVAFVCMGMPARSVQGVKICSTRRLPDDRWAGFPVATLEKPRFSPIWRAWPGRQTNFFRHHAIKLQKGC